jgi:hypothetical protein
MDWSSIEKDFLADSQARWRPNAAQKTLSLKNTAHSSDQPRRSSRLLGSGVEKEGILALMTDENNSGQIPHGGGGEVNMEYILKEMNNLRKISSEQGQRLVTYEKLLMSQGTYSETVQNDLLGRISELEQNLANARGNASGMSNTNLLRDADDQQFIKAKYDDMIYDRIGKLEDDTKDLRTRLGESVVADIGKMLNSTLDHVSSLGSLTEKAKKRSDQAVVLLESLLQALAGAANSDELDEGDFESSMVDFFSQISVGDGSTQQKRIVHLLMDSIQKTVDRSIRNQIGPAIECLNDLFTPQLRMTESTLEKKIADVDFTLKSIHSTVFSRFEKNESILVDLQRSMSKCEDVMAVSLRDEKVLKEAVTELEENMRSVRTSAQEQKELLSAVSSRHTARQTQHLDVAGAKESVQKVQDEISAFAKNHDNVKNDIEDLKFDLVHVSEKHNLREAETDERLTRVAADAKDDFNSLRNNYRQMQAHIEQQVGELTRKFNKVERTSTKEGKVKDASSGESPDKATSEQLRMVQESCKLLDEGQDGLRQSLANVTFDFDDLKHRQDFLDKQISYLKEGKMSSSSSPSLFTGASHSSSEESVAEIAVLGDKVVRMEGAIASLREAMDTLQDEIIMLSPPEGIEKNGGNSSVDLNAVSVPDFAVPAEPTPSKGQSIDPPDVVDGVKYYSSKKVPIGTKTVAASPNECVGGDIKKKMDISKQLLDSDSSSDSDFASSSESSYSDEEDDIIGTKPKAVLTTAVTIDSSGPSPSDVLADQLRLRADFEREEALKRVAATKSKSSSPPAKSPIKSGGTIDGPPISAVVDDIEKRDSPPKPPPIVSGSLLTGAGRRTSRNVGFASGPTVKSSSTGKPIFETLGASHAMPPAAPAAGAASPAELIASRKDTVQCTHCLRRLPKLSITAHSRTCELRTELCRNGCGAKVLVLKMEKHMETCGSK